MVDFGARSADPEHMDSPAVAGVDLDRALVELARVNRFLGGHRAALEGLAELAPQTGRVQVLDLGCGGGDVAREMVAWARGRGLVPSVVAVDFNPRICARARQEQGSAAVQVLCADAFALPFARGAFDVVHCGHFLHHFQGERAVDLLRIMRDLCRRGFIVNDLERHPLAYRGIQVLTRLFSRSQMVRHDGPVSVLRGFRTGELEELAASAGVGPLHLRRRWAFRLLATGRP